MWAGVNNTSTNTPGCNEMMEIVRNARSKGRGMDCKPLKDDVVCNRIENFIADESRGNEEQTRPRSQPSATLFEVGTKSSPYQGRLLGAALGSWTLLTQPSTTPDPTYISPLSGRDLHDFPHGGVSLKGEQKAAEIAASYERDHASLASQLLAEGARCGGNLRIVALFRCHRGQCQTAVTIIIHRNNSAGNHPNPPSLSDDSLNGDLEAAIGNGQHAEQQPVLTPFPFLIDTDKRWFYIIFISIMLTHFIACFDGTQPSGKKPFPIAGERTEDSHGLRSTRIRRSSMGKLVPIRGRHTSNMDYPPPQSKFYSMAETCAGSRTSGRTPLETRRDKTTTIMLRSERAESSQEGTISVQGAYRRLATMLQHDLLGYIALEVDVGSVSVTEELLLGRPSYRQCLSMSSTRPSYPQGTRPCFLVAKAEFLLQCERPLQSTNTLIMRRSGAIYLPASNKTWRKRINQNGLFYIDEFCRERPHDLPTELCCTEEANTLINSTVRSGIYCSEARPDRNPLLDCRLLWTRKH
ncbi:hypothetical protein M426DRAFT_9715 [Hypoxylon sp. CI-4A]|nr:hypothetical protein M426DRAFT_9715 [Hypoxylon sp. CI-4A]